MTVLVAVTIRCDWCSLPIATTAPVGARNRSVPADQLASEIDRLEELINALTVTADDRQLSTRLGHRIPGPPGRPSHLCRTCHDRGTPPLRRPVHPKRRTTRTRT